jgi:hypothetical protein
MKAMAGSNGPFCKDMIVDVATHAKDSEWRKHATTALDVIIESASDNKPFKPRLMQL